MDSKEGSLDNIDFKDCKYDRGDSSGYAKRLMPEFQVPWFSTLAPS